MVRQAAGAPRSFSVDPLNKWTLTVQWNENGWASSLIPPQSPLERNGVVLSNFGTSQRPKLKKGITETQRQDRGLPRGDETVIGSNKQDLNLPIQCVRTSLRDLCFDDPLMKVMPVGPLTCLVRNGAIQKMEGVGNSLCHTGRKL